MRSKLLGGITAMSIMLLAPSLHANNGLSDVSGSSDKASQRADHAKTNQF